MSESALSAMPATVSGRAPSRSARLPANGATRPRATGMAMSSRPACAGRMPRPRSKKNGTQKSTPNRTRYHSSPLVIPMLKLARGNSERSSMGPSPGLTQHEGDAE